MKKLFTLIIAFFSISFAANAQRMIDLSATMTAPAANATIDSGVTFNTKVTVTNVGTTQLKTSDSMIYSIFLGNAGMVFPPDQQTTIFYRTNKVLNQNDTMVINRNFSINYTTPTNNDTIVNYCVVVGVLNRSADSARDNMTTNNSGCKSVTRKAAYNPGVGISIITGTNDINTLNSVHPNPASQSFTIDLNMTNSHNVIIRVLDIAGRTVLMQDRGKLRAGQHLMRLDTDQLHTGLYLYQVNIDGDIKSGKIAITK